jgi:hypothetical protein
MAALKKNPVPMLIPAITTTGLARSARLGALVGNEGRNWRTVAPYAFVET